MINDIAEARTCLNLPGNSTSTAPLPIVLETTITDDDFICPNQTPFYAFYCVAHGYTLLWSFNGDIVTVFLPLDSVGYFVPFTYYRNVFDSRSEPVYNVTVVLTFISNTIRQENSNNNIMIPILASTMIVQPFNASQSQDLPFNVSCQTFCQNESHAQVCQTKHYKVAGMLHYSLMHISYIHCCDSLASQPLYKERKGLVN